MVAHLPSQKMRTAKHHQKYVGENNSENIFDRLWAIMRSEWYCREIEEINIQRWGDIVYSKAMALSKKVNDDLLSPIGKWIDDPGWVKKFQIIEDDIPNWSIYKRSQRHRIRRLKALGQERLRDYWQELRRRRNYRKEVSRLSAGIPRKAGFQIEISEDFMSPIISPFSPPAQLQAETLRQFQQSRKTSFSDLLPWRLLLSSELTTVKSFSDLKVYGHYKQDKAAKLIHLLHMETEGKVKIIQKKPFGDIRIEPMDIVPMYNIMVKDRHSCKYFFQWDNLSDNQRDRIIADIKASRILCKAV